MIRIKYSRRTNTRVKARLKNKARIRKKVAGTSERPRLAVFRSCKHIYAQLIDDGNGATLVAVSTRTPKAGGSKNVNGAKSVGAELAKAALAKNIKNVVFDRSGYVYHGRVKAVADGAREAGLNF